MKPSSKKETDEKLVFLEDDFRNITNCLENQNVW